MQPRISLLAITALLAAPIGCTVQSTPTFPDGGPLEREDGGVDAGPDGGRLPDPTIDTCTPEGMGATLGQSCASDAACNDGCYCNGIEVCGDDGTCAMGADPCVDEVECTADACLEEVNRCFHDPRHEMCGNGDACDGVEICDPTFDCSLGVPPYCNDEDSCTIDSCDMVEGCLYAPRDLDGDGYTDGRCGGEDCDDDPRFGTDIFPGAIELCMNRRDDDCDGSRDYNDRDCLPTNDRCESAVVLDGPGTYSGSTSSLASSYSLSCRTSSGPDAVFRFELTEMQDVRVTVAGGGSNVGVALRRWDQCSAGPDDKCNAGAAPLLLRRSLPAGEYALIVQSNSPGAAFDLTLQLSAPTEVPRFDVCDDTTEDLCGGMPCTTLTGATFTGLFAETEDDYDVSCAGGSTNLRDAVYRFTIDRPKDVTISASTSGSNPWAPTSYLVLTNDCGATSGELRCVASSSAMFRQRELPPGTYYVMIESSDSNPVSWSMNVTITDPVPRNRGDACSNPIDISEPTLGAGGSGTVSISTLELDTGTSCGGGEFGRDATFVFTTTALRDVTLTVSSGGFSWDTHYASLREVCGRADTDLRCWSFTGTASTAQSWRSLPAGTYYVTVSSGASSGDIRASIVTRDPTPVPPNDRCDGAIPLAPLELRRDTTIGFSDDGTGGSCAGTGRPDAFYTFTLADRQDIILTVQDADGGATPYYVTVRDGCPGMGAGRVHACQIASTTPPSTATVSTTLDRGTYHVMVETPATDMSDFQIRLVVFPPAP